MSRVRRILPHHPRRATGTAIGFPRHAGRAHPLERRRSALADRDRGPPGRRQARKAPGAGCEPLRRHRRHSSAGESDHGPPRHRRGSGRTDAGTRQSLTFQEAETWRPLPASISSARPLEAYVRSATELAVWMRVGPPSVSGHSRQPSDFVTSVTSHRCPGLRCSPGPCSSSGSMPGGRILRSRFACHEAAADARAPRLDEQRRFAHEHPAHIRLRDV